MTIVEPGTMQVKEPGTFALHSRSPPTQDFIPQSKIHLQQSPDIEGYYHSRPQNQSYMTTIDSQRAFSDSISYNRSHADMNYNLPQSRNEFLMGRLTPATASNASGYGNLGSSFSNPGSFLSNPSLGNMKSSSNFNEILPSEYSGGRNLSSTHRVSFTISFDWSFLYDVVNMVIIAVYYYYYFDNGCYMIEWYWPHYVLHYYEKMAWKITHC